MTLLAWEMSTIVQLLVHSLVLSFLGIGVKTDIFQSSGQCCIFQICRHIECSTLMASSFMVFSSIIEIPSHPPTLLIAVLPKAGR